jgi:hypothetical protein
MTSLASKTGRLGTFKPSMRRIEPILSKNYKAYLAKKDERKL